MLLIQGSISYSLLLMPLKLFFRISTLLYPLSIFWKGDSNLRHSVPFMGPLLLARIHFFFYGLFVIIKSPTRWSFLLLWGMICGFVPASLTNEGIPHYLRAIPALFFVEMISCLGMYRFFSRFLLLFKMSMLLLFLNVLVFLWLFWGPYSQIIAPWNDSSVSTVLQLAEKEHFYPLIIRRESLVSEIFDRLTILASSPFRSQRQTSFLKDQMT